MNVYILYILDTVCATINKVGAHQIGRLYIIDACIHIYLIIPRFISIFHFMQYNIYICVI